MEFSNNFKAYLVDLLQKNMKDVQISQDRKRVYVRGSLDHLTRDIFRQFMVGVTGSNIPQWDYQGAKVAIGNDGLVSFSFPLSWL